MELGQRQYYDPHMEVPVTLVITGDGSEKYKFISSISHGPENWMKQMYEDIADRPIKSLIMTGTHNSGMSRISEILKSTGNSVNVQNQGVNIYDQLRCGARYLDLQVITVGKEFWIAHINDENCDSIIHTASGESLGEVVSEINKFTTETDGKVIFHPYQVPLCIGPSLGRWYRYLDPACDR